MGRGSSVGIETRYGLITPGIESQWGANFLHPSRTTRGSPTLLFSGHQVSFPGVKRPGRAVNHPPTSNVEVKERARVVLLRHLWSYMLNITSLCIALFQNLSTTIKTGNQLQLNNFTVIYTGILFRYSITKSLLQICRISFVVSCFVVPSSCHKSHIKPTALRIQP